MAKKSVGYTRAIVLGPMLKIAPPWWLRNQLRRLALKGSDLRVGVDGGCQFWIDTDYPVPSKSHYEIPLSLKNAHQMHPQMGPQIAPDIAIGDWDSLEADPRVRPEYKKTQILTLPQEKDRSDLACTLEVLRDLKVSEVILLGFTGGRPDHHLASLIEMAQCAAKTARAVAPPAKSHRSAIHGSATGRSTTIRSAAARNATAQKIAAISPEGEYYWVGPKQPLLLAKLEGRLVSVFAWNGKAEGVVMEGFDYPYSGGLVSSSHGLSNRVLADSKRKSAKITVGKGLLLVVVPSLQSTHTDDLRSFGSVE